MPCMGHGWLSRALAHKLLLLSNLLYYYSIYTYYLHIVVPYIAFLLPTMPYYYDTRAGPSLGILVQGD